MAYLDLDLGPDRPRTAPPATAPAALAGPVPVVGAAERQTIRLAAGDTSSSLRDASRTDVVLHWLFGRTRPNRLADPRLEALRRYAVLLRLHGRALPQVESGRLQDAGFSVGAIAEIRRLVQGRPRQA